MMAPSSEYRTTRLIQLFCCYTK